MNISSVGSPAQYVAQLDPGSGVSAAVAGKELGQVKIDGEEALDLIQSADPSTDGGHSVSVYA